MINKNIKTDKEIKIDEIIKLVKEVNYDNKKFASTKDNFTIQKRHDALDSYFRKFKREIIRDRNTVNIANKFNVSANDGLNITTSKDFYRQISDKNLDILLNSLKKFQDPENKTRTYDGWKKQHDEFKNYYMPKVINKLKSDRLDIYEYFKNENFSDERIFYIYLDASENCQYEFKYRFNGFEMIEDHYTVYEMLESMIESYECFK